MQKCKITKKIGLLAALIVSVPGFVCAEESVAPLSGPYFSMGVFAGGNFSQQTVSLRLPNGHQQTLSAELVTPSTNAGIRLGWGQVLTENIYLGLEAEGVVPFQSSTEQAVLGVRYVSKLRPEGAGFARVGWTSDGKSLFFVRAGAVNLSRTTEVPLYNYKSSADSGWAPAIGVGLEVALTKSVSIRLDMSHANASGETNLKTFQGALGISYRF
jgi:opacity protein-like surface antigen